MLGLTFVAAFLAIPATSGTTSAHFRLFHDPRIRNNNGTSSNWSGFAVQEPSLVKPASNVFNDAKGQWTITTVSCPGGSQYSSAWVGIDGYSSGSVEQTGTDEDCSNGSPTYYAWYEVYPKASVVISGLAVHPGDNMSADVHYDGSGGFVLTITDTTTHQSFTTTQRAKRAQRSSAEWIVEAPSSGGILPLADYGTISMTNNTATDNTHTGNIADPVWQYDAITMASGSTTKATVSSLSGGDSFTDTWHHS
jgi:hypothetical protein